MTRLFLLWLLCLYSPLMASTVLHQQQSQYSLISVLEKGHIRCLEFDSSKIGQTFYQGCLSTRDYTMIFSYTKATMASLFLKPDPKRILVIGLGAGIVPKSMYFLHPTAHFDIVDIDEAVVDIAETFFSFPKVANMQVTIGDGRVFVNEAIQKGVQYDIVVLDAFNGEYIPEHLMTQEFLHSVKQVLTDDGVVAANTFTRSTLYDHESTTYASVFGGFYNVQLEGKSTNRVILATKKDGFAPVADVHNNAAAYYPVFQKMFDIDANALLPKMEMSPNWDTTARVLTDQYSPVNALNNGERVQYLALERFDEIIRRYPFLFVVALMIAVTLLFFIILVLCRCVQRLKSKGAS